MLPIACGTKLKEVKIVIEFRNVSKVYDSTDTHALNHVNIKIEDGEFVFVVGSSGAGKSTFLKLIMHEEKPTEGEVIFNAAGPLLPPHHGYCVPGLPPDPQDDGV